MADQQFEYRVMFRHYDDTVCEYSTGLTEEASARDVARIIKSGREAWTERRPIPEWERVA
jgi:hypothetical protein